jgi:hypothetical protein
MASSFFGYLTYKEFQQAQLRTAHTAQLRAEFSIPEEEHCRQIARKCLHNPEDIARRAQRVVDFFAERTPLDAGAQNAGEREVFRLCRVVVGAPSHAATHPCRATGMGRGALPPNAPVHVQRGGRSAHSPRLNTTVTTTTPRGGARSPWGRCAARGSQPRSTP